jgi:hypothetical protein
MDSKLLREDMHNWWVDRMYLQDVWAVASKHSTDPSTQVGSALVVSGGVGITGNVFLSSANNFINTPSDTSYRLGWPDNYFHRSALYGGVNFTGTFLNVTPILYAT